MNREKKKRERVGEENKNIQKLRQKLIDLAIKREMQRDPELAEIFILSKEISFNHKQRLIAGRLYYNSLSIISSFRNQCFNDISGNFQ